MTAKLAAAVAALIGLAASVVEIWTVFGFYPVTVLLLLGVLVVASLGLAWRHRGDEIKGASVTLHAREGERSHDRGVVGDVRGTVTREDIEWLRRWDFGGGWRAEEVDPYYELRRLDDVEHRPLHDELAASFAYLMHVATVFTEALNLHTFPDHRTGQDWRNLGWSSGEADGLQGEARELWEERRRVVNDSADVLVEAYDDFLEIARRNLLL